MPQSIRSISAPVGLEEPPPPLIVTSDDDDGDTLRAQSVVSRKLHTAWNADLEKSASSEYKEDAADELFIEENPPTGCWYSTTALWSNKAVTRR